MSDVFNIHIFSSRIHGVEHSTTNRLTPISKPLTFSHGFSLVDKLATPQVLLTRNSLSTIRSHMPRRAMVKNSEGLYLDGGNTWMCIERAWSYTSMVAFVDAENYKAKVYLHLPSGREIEVLPEDFNLKDF